MKSRNPLSPVEWRELLGGLASKVAMRKGKVVSVHPFGVFADIGLDPGLSVLLEIIHFRVVEDQPGHGINFAEDYP